MEGEAHYKCLYSIERDCKSRSTGCILVSHRGHRGTEGGMDTEGELALARRAQRN